MKDVSEGRVDLDALQEDELPAELKPLPRAERAEVVRRNDKERRHIQGKIRELSGRRQAYIAEELKKTTAAPESLDHKLYSAIKDQAGKKGMIYDKGPSY